MKLFSRIYTALIFILLYAPIAVMILYSFNSGKSPAVFQGFSLKWYQELFSSATTFSALRNTLLLALTASLVATVIGTMAAYGMYCMKNRRLKDALQTVTSIPMMNPDIVTGISMMLLFVFAGSLLSLSNKLSFGTILCAHITFCLPYVILSVLPKLRQMDPHLTEAAMDLGCTPFRAFFKVELPAILPGVLTGALMSFTMSLDDFVISYFTGGNFQTLPILIYSMTKKRVTPDMYALSSLMFLVIFALLLLNNYLQGRSDRQKLRLAKKKHKLSHAPRKADIPVNQ
jgi:spermidine/putrescine transport system permease protein